MKLILCTVMYLSLATISYSQSSGSGTLQWGQYNCSDGSECDRRINQEDSYTIVAEEYGTLSITGQVGALIGICGQCQFPSNPIASGVRLNCTQNLGSFNTSLTNFTIPCMAPGDSVCLQFFTIGTGLFGNYSFTSSFIPDDPQGNEIEPNNTLETAQSLTTPYPLIQGHIYYSPGISSPNLDNIDYFEIGYLEIGDSIHLAYDATANTGNCQLQRIGSTTALIGIGSGASDYHIVSTPDIYYIRVSNVGNAPCSPYTVQVTGDQGRREYLVSKDAIEIDYDPDEDKVFVYGDFTDKSIEITNVFGSIVEDLSGMNSPIVFDVTSLPSGKHFLIIRDDINTVLHFQDLIKD